MNKNDMVSFIITNLKDLKINLIDEDELKFGNSIGAGGYGQVFKGMYKDNSVAIKKLLITPDDKPESLVELSKEIQFIQVAENENLPKFYGIMVSKKEGNVHLISEFINGKNLQDAFPTMNDDEKLDVIYQTCFILDQLHNKKLLHRDLKPANIMVEDGHKIRLIDFGISKVAQKTVTHTKNCIGTVPYMSPEYYDIVLEIDPNNDKPIAISNKADMWAVGAITSEIFSGFIPWTNKCKNNNQIEKSLTLQHPFPIPDIKNKIALGICEQCLKIDPIERANASDIIKYIQEQKKNI